MTLKPNTIFWHKLYPCLIENWPPSLMALAGQQTLIHLTITDMKAILSAVRDVGYGFTSAERQSTDSIEAKVDQALCEYPDGTFMRLGALSAKDSWRYSQSSGRIFSGQDAIEILTWGSRRVAYILRLCLIAKHETTIVLRPWYYPPLLEFRIFIRDGLFVGSSQASKHAIQNNHRHIIRSLQNIAGNIIKTGLINGVVDVFVNSDMKATLFDINPFSSCSDPMLFSWKNGGDFDKSIRFTASSATTQHDGNKWGQC